MSTSTETQPRRERNWLYITACVLLAVLVIGALIAFRSAKSTREARDKADQLIAALDDAGFRTPDRDQIVRVLGTDGGATCTDPNKALNRAILLSQLANGASGPGARPVLADSRVFQGQKLIIKIYCPENLDDFEKFLSDLQTADVAGD